MFGVPSRPPPPPLPRSPAMQRYDFALEYIMKAALGGNLVSAAHAYKVYDDLVTEYIRTRAIEEDMKK